MKYFRHEIFAIYCVYLRLQYSSTDRFQITISGVFRGVGKQYLAAIINFLCYNVLGLSVGVPLALKANLGTIGLWAGLATGNVIQVDTRFVGITYHTHYTSLHLLFE